MRRFSAREYLMIDIANSYGLDKKDWSERLAWFGEHEGRLKEMLPKASDPAMYYAGVQAWEQVKAGQPIGYPISLDATASGLQLLAVLTGDRSAAELCNVVDTGHREDAYTGIYQNMVGKLGEETKIKRDDVKGAIVPALYGSTAKPKEIFGKGPLLTAFIETMRELAPAAWELNEVFIELWDPEALSNDWVLPDNFHVRCKVMAPVAETVHFLNEPVEITYKVNAPTAQGRSLGANCIHSLDAMIVREMSRRCSYDPTWVQLIRDTLDGEVESRFATTEEKEEAVRMVMVLWDHYVDSGYLSARILDYIDSDTLTLVEPEAIRDLIDSLPAKPFSVVSTHDCFRVLPSYGNDIRWQYNLQLHLIARSNMLSFLLSQITGRKLAIGKLDPTLADDILDADYALS
jgi:hypothetical protein